MHAGLIERIPAGALGIFAVAVEIGLAAILIDDVVLARHVMHVEFRLADHLVGIVEFGGAREMRDITGMDHERGALRHRADLVDRLLQRGERVRIGGFVEADMAVADLQEGEAGGALLGGLRIAEQIQRFWHAARDGPEHARARPDHAFQCVAPVDAVVVVSHVGLLQSVGTYG